MKTPRSKQTRCTLIVVATIATVAMSSGVVRADDEALRFSVDPRARGCPTASEFRREVERQTGSDGAAAPSGAHAPHAIVTIEVTETGALRARVDVDVPSKGDVPSRRRQTLTAPAYACRDLSSAAAIAVSLVFRDAAERQEFDEHASTQSSDGAATGQSSAGLAPGGASAPSAAERPSFASPSSEPAKSTNSGRASPPAGARRATSNSQGSNARESSLRHSLFAGVTFGRMASPDVGVATLIGYGARWHDRVGLTAEASATFPRVASGARGAGVVVTTRTLSIAPCAYWGIALGCAYGAVGSTVGVGTHVRFPETQQFVFAELGLRVGARIPLARPFSLRTELRSGLPLVISRFLVEGDTVWRMPAVTVTGSVSLETTF